LRLVRVFVQRDPVTGKRQYNNRTVHGIKRDAEQVLAEMLRERSLGPTLATSSRLEVAPLLDTLVDDYRINGKSVDWAELVVRVHLKPFFGKFAVRKMSTDAARQYIAKRQADGAANATINRELSLLRRAFNLAGSEDPPRIAHVPKIPRLEENNVRRAFSRMHSIARC
jgi:hypothetical protein